MQSDLVSMASLYTVPADALCGKTPLFPDIGYTYGQMETGIREAMAFHADFMTQAKICPERGLVGAAPVEWAARLLRKRGIAGAVIEKMGSLTFTKRRPADVSQFQAHAEEQCVHQRPLIFRVAFGPLKNINCCGTRQAPDLAEYLTFIQLARLMAALAPLYPYGIKVQLVPDDLRARQANLCPESYTSSYINGLRQLVHALRFEDWLEVEAGEQRLYQLYNVNDYRAAAEMALRDWQRTEPDSYAVKWASALENAERNLPLSMDCNRAEEVPAAAWRYMKAHQAELLSGMWSQRKVFPVIYANHPNAYQIYSMGHKKSKLPWQVALPLSLLDHTALADPIDKLFKNIQRVCGPHETCALARVCGGDC